MDKRESLVREWIHKAEHDLGMADLALQNRPEFTDSICFHCQQAAEKYLKAYLVHLDTRFERKHHLVYLLDLISDKETIAEMIYEIAENLEGYAVEVRYPDDWRDISLKEAEEALLGARQVKTFVLERLSAHKINIHFGENGDSNETSE